MAFLYKLALKIGVSLIHDVLPFVKRHWLAFVVAFVCGMLFRWHEAKERLQQLEEKEKIRIEVDSMQSDYQAKVAAYEARQKVREMQNRELRDSVAKAATARRYAEANYKATLEKLKLQAPEELQPIIRELNEHHTEVISEYQTQLLATAKLLMNEQAKSSELEDQLVNAENVNRVLRKKIDELTVTHKPHSALTDLAIGVGSAALGFGLGMAIQ